MNQILLNGINLSDLLENIGKIIDQKLQNIQGVNINDQKYLSRTEVCELLKVSLPTLNEWTKLGRLKSYKIGNRVLYKKNEIEESINKVETFRHKRI